MEDFELEVLMNIEKFIKELDAIWLEYKEKFELDRSRM
jgi:hypothetical protein